MTFASRDLLVVGLGSAIGAALRYGLSLALLATIGPAFPWGTLAANGLGAFLIGVLTALTLSGRSHLFLVTGFCGGFTTFSIFSLEALLFLQAGAIPTALVYILASLAVWLGAVWAGYGVGRRLR